MVEGQNSHKVMEGEQADEVFSGFHKFKSRDRHASVAHGILLFTVACRTAMYVGSSKINVQCVPLAMCPE